MNLYTTIMRAKNEDGEFKSYAGQHVPGISFNDAQEYCDRNGLNCRVCGLLIAEIPCKPGTCEPDWGKMIDYEVYKLN